jgi:hypothetical protein
MSPVPVLLLYINVPHGVTTQKTPFFIVTAVKTSDLVLYNEYWGIYPAVKRLGREADN